MELENFNTEIDAIHDLDTLILMKRAIKENVTNPKMNWADRTVLYTKVQLINERIQTLTTW